MVQNEQSNKMNKTNITDILNICHTCNKGFSTNGNLQKHFQTKIHNLKDTESNKKFWEDK